MLKYLATAGVNNNAISEIAPMSLASTGNLLTHKLLIGNYFPE